MTGNWINLLNATCTGNGNCFFAGILEAPCHLPCLRHGEKLQKQGLRELSASLSYLIFRTRKPGTAAPVELKYFESSLKPWSCNGFPDFTEKSPGVSAICAGRAFLSIVRVCLAAGPNPERRLWGKISQLVSFRRRGRQGALPNSRDFPVAPSADRTGQGLFQAPAEHLLNRNTISYRQRL